MEKMNHLYETYLGFIDPVVGAHPDFGDVLEIQKAFSGKSHEIHRKIKVFLMFFL